MHELELSASKRLCEEALTLIPGASQTMSKRPESFAFGAMPIYLERGQGCYVWDIDGNRYLDFIGALGPITLGYCYPAVDEALRRQIAQGTIFSMMHPVEVEAARAIVECVPCAEMVRFLKTGAEATSAAVRIARAFTGRELVVSSGYHGWLDTWTAERPSPGDRGVPKALKSTIEGFAFGDFDSDNCLEAVLKRHSGQAACIIMEPVSYANTDCGEYLKWARQLADRHGALLIFDEIVSGFRVALGGAQEHFGVTPDLACFAKGISNGLPVSAVAGRKNIMLDTRDVLISSTYGGDALSLAAVVTCLGEYKEKQVIAHLWTCGQRLLSGLNDAAQSCGLAFKAQGFPMMSSFGFLYDSPQDNADLMTLLLQEMARRGILLRRGGLNFVNFSHKQEHIEHTLEVCREVFPLLKQAHDSGSIAEKLLCQKSVTAGIRRF